MNEDYSEENVNFLEMSDDELSEIVNANLGCYRRTMVDGAKEELKKREGLNSRGDSEREAASEEAYPPELRLNPPEGNLFSVGQITLATFFGAPIAGCLLAARNYQVLGKSRSAWLSLAAGIISTTLLFIIVFFLPENFPNSPLPAVSCVGMYYYAKQSQGGAIESHFNAGGRQRSWAIPVFVGIVCSVVILALFVGAGIMFDLGSSQGWEDIPVVRVKVSQAGEIDLDGTIVTRGQLRYALARVKTAGGGVMYYRERWPEPPSAEAIQVFQLIKDADLPVRMSSKPNFSDYIGPDGIPVPSQ